MFGRTVSRHGLTTLFHLEIPIMERNESKQAGMGNSSTNQGQFGQGTKSGGQPQQSTPDTDVLRKTQGNKPTNEDAWHKADKPDAPRDVRQPQQSQPDMSQQGAEQLDKDAQRSKSSEQGQQGMTGEKGENSSRRNP
jgi:hypothetical protein